MNHYAVLKIDKYHTFSQIREQQIHNEREINMPHIDNSKTIQNVQLVSPGGSVSEAWKRRKENIEAQTGHKLATRSTSVLAVEVMLSFSHDADIPVKKWSAKNMEWLEETFGKENILSCTLHMDESTPHIHATIIPIDENNRLSARNVIGGPNGMRKLQSSYGQAMEEFGLRRGIDQRKKAKRDSLVNFYDAINKIDETPAPVREMGESDEEYIMKLTSYCRSMKMAYLNMQYKANRTDEIAADEASKVYKNNYLAIQFYNLLLERLGSKESADKKLKDLAYLISSVPQDKLELVIDNLKDRFPAQENVLNHKRGNNNGKRKNSIDYGAGR